MFACGFACFRFVACSVSSFSSAESGRAQGNTLHAGLLERGESPSNERLALMEHCLLQQSKNMSPVSSFSSAESGRAQGNTLHAGLLERGESPTNERPALVEHCLLQQSKKMSYRGVWLVPARVLEKSDVTKSLNFEGSILQCNREGIRTKANTEKANKQVGREPLLQPTLGFTDSREEIMILIQPLLFLARRKHVFQLPESATASADLMP